MEPNYLVDREMKSVITRLAKLVKNHDESLGQLCERTMTLAAPERIHKTRLSPVLNQNKHFNLYLRQFLVLLKLLGTTPEAFFVGTDQARLLKQLSRLPAAERREIEDLIQAKAQLHRSPPPPKQP